MNIDLDLIKKYNRPGPRYTSYPTAPHFSTDVRLADWQTAIDKNNIHGTKDLSLYFHLPFCDTLCWFCGCTMMVTRNRESIDEYLNFLSKEIELSQEAIHSGRKVVQLHYGGGTPTHLSPDQIRHLGSKIHQAFTISDDAEIGCEMDPRELTREHIIALRETGFNRASIGVQDFNPVVQKAVNRINPPEMVRDVVSWICEEGFSSLNLDMIYGLPHQTTKTFSKTLDLILALEPDRLAVFNYAHVPWIKPHQKLINERDLPSPEEKMSMLKLIIERLTSSGYVYIGMDHFARQDDELTMAQIEKTLQRNFQGYSTRAKTDIYALGLSSISQVDGMYAQNFKELPHYYQQLTDGKLPYEKGVKLTADDQVRREVIMRLMCDMELDYPKMSKIIEMDFEKYFGNTLSALSEFEEDGLISQSLQGFTVTDTGRLFIRNIAMIFDTYVGTSNLRYSKTV